MEQQHSVRPPLLSPGLDPRALAFQTRSTALLLKRQAKVGRTSSQLNYLVHQAWELVESLEILPRTEGETFLRRYEVPIKLGAELRETLEALEEGALQKDRLCLQAAALEKLASNLDRIPA